MIYLLAYLSVFRVFSQEAIPGEMVAICQKTFGFFTFNSETTHTHTETDDNMRIDKKDRKAVYNCHYVTPLWCPLQTTGGAQVPSGVCEPNTWPLFLNALL